MIKVLLAEDCTLLRESIKYMLEKDGELQVVGMAENGEEAIKLYKQLSPDLILMDAVMPVCDGVTATKIIKASNMATRIIIFTAHSDSKNIYRILQSGADGYMLKDVQVIDLVLAIKNVINGFQIIHRNFLPIDVTIFNDILSQMNPASSLESEAALPEANLDSREISIVKLIVQGKSNKEIAYALKLSEGRVKNIITGILKKLNIHDRIQLVVYAIKENIV